MLFGGCKSAPEIRQTAIIRDTVYNVVPKPIIDSGKVKAVRIEGQSILQFLRLQGTDTLINVDYNPADSVMKVKAKPDTVKIRIRDTVVKYEFLLPPSKPKVAPLKPKKERGYIISDLKVILGLILAILILLKINK